MASQSGVWRFDGAPVHDAAVRLVAALEPLAGDGVSLALSGEVVLAYGARHVWTGESIVRQPLRSASGLCLTFDGRLDNACDLRLSLGSDRSLGDAHLALAVFERWGIDGLRRLIGDWSLVIWDSRCRRLHLARDYMGVRPLFYHVDARAVSWSTSLGELAVRAGCADDLEPAFAARFMALTLSTDVTPYRGVRGVPTATCVTVAPDGAESRRRFWRLEPGTLRYARADAYEAHLRALWAEAVGSRLRTPAPVWAELSGGLDSSSVVCMAAALVEGGLVDATALETVSHVVADSVGGDERPFIAAVEQATGIASHQVGLAEHEADRSEHEWVTPFAFRGPRLASMRVARSHGARVMLTGRLGDLVMGGVADNSAAVFDDLARFDFREAFSQLRLWSRATHAPLAELVWNLAKIARPDAWRVVRPEPAGLELLTPATRRLLEAPAPAHPAVEARWSAQELVASLLDSSVTGRLGVAGEDEGVDFTHPLTHRPLVDFVLSIPARELASPGLPRSLMRRAFAGFVPAKVLTRRSKGYYPPSMSRAMRPRAARLRPVGATEAVRRGWLDPDRLDAAISRLLHGSGDMAGEVQRALRLEEWLNARDRRAPAATPQRKEVTTNADLFIA